LGQPRRAAFFALLPVALVWSHYVILSATGRTGLLGLGATVWFLGSCVLLERRADTRTEPQSNLPAPSENRTEERETLIAAA
jgi:hypothetical protein